MSQNNDKTRQGQVIDENLKRVYQDMLEEKVPDRFLDLLTQLKEQESASKKGGNAKGAEIRATKSSSISQPSEPSHSA